jgi:transcriptional regulator
MAEDETVPDGEERDREVMRLRESGVSWQEIGQRLGLTRQQARYAYQRAQREERRRARRSQ